MAQSAIANVRCSCNCIIFSSATDPACDSENFLTEIYKNRLYVELTRSLVKLFIYVTSKVEAKYKQ